MKIKHIFFYLLIIWFAGSALIPANPDYIYLPHPKPVGGRSITLKTTASNTIRYTDLTTNHLIDTANVDWGVLQAGDTLKIPVTTTYQDFTFFNLFAGTPSAPVIFVKSGAGQLKIQRGTLSTTQPNPCRIVGHDWKFLMNLDVPTGYGCIIGGFNTTNNYAVSAMTLFGAPNNSYNFEIAGVEFAYAGRAAFMNPSTGNRMPNISFHDNYVHDLTFGSCTSGCTSEGLYWGLSNAANYNSAPRLDSVEIYNCRFENLAGDGLQFKFMSNANIHDNYFYRTGFGLSPGQGDAVQIGEFSDTIRIYNNIFDSCAQHAILNKGLGPQIIRKNTFKRMNNQGSTNDAIYINSGAAGVVGPGLLQMQCDSNTFLLDTLGNALIHNATSLSLQDTGHYVQNCDTNCVALSGQKYQLSSKDIEITCSGIIPPLPTYDTSYYYINQRNGIIRKERKIKRTN